MFGFVSEGLAIAFLILPLFSVIRLIRKKDHSWAGWIRGFLIWSVACYCLLLVSVRFADMYFEHRLDKYDLDGDGMFSGAEVTPGMQAAMSDLTNDTGRSLAPITGLIASPIYCGFWHLLIGMPYLLMTRGNEPVMETKRDQVTSNHPP